MIENSLNGSEKQLYNYQKGAIKQIFEKFESAPNDYHLLYQLPTGGGKTVISSNPIDLVGIESPSIIIKISLS